MVAAVPPSLLAEVQGRGRDVAEAAEAEARRAGGGRGIPLLSKAAGVL